MSEAIIASEPTPKPVWQPLAPVDRRVLGVLVEKAKTTPDTYPLSLNALSTGCNQKNNRDPVMQLAEHDVEESLVRLRLLGAVTEVYGSGRVARFRHELYAWLGVDKVELAVMAEVLLRGPQTEGELRGRVARMEPIPDLTALRPVLASLKAKGLLIALTAEGRGHVVTHALYLPRELEEVRAHHQSMAPAPSASAPPPKQPLTSNDDELGTLRLELKETRELIVGLRRDLDELTAGYQRCSADLTRLKEALGG